LPPEEEARTSAHAADLDVGEEENRGRRHREEEEGTEPASHGSQRQKGELRGSEDEETEEADELPEADEGIKASLERVVANERRPPRAAGARASTAVDLHRRPWLLPLGCSIQLRRCR
jgi:hypothetical protein